MRWKYRYMITSFAGNYQPDNVDSLLIDLKKTVKKIENLLHDNTKSEFIPVCIPELMAINETKRLIDDLVKFEVHPRQLIINNVLQTGEDDFCKRKKAHQQKYLQVIHHTFNTLNMVVAPLFPEEIKGLEALDELRKHLFEEMNQAIMIEKKADYGYW